MIWFEDGIQEKSSNVNHPTHYQIIDGVEAIDIIEAVLGDGFSDYCYGNVLKYILRAPNKNGLEDLKKAQVYLDWLIDEIESMAFVNKVLKKDR